MRSSRALLLAGSLLVCGLLAAAPAARAAGERTVLGPGGQTVRLLQDAYGELFPIGSEADPRHPVLALERDAGGGRVSRTLVPGTSGPEEETEFSLLYEKVTDSLFVLWESRQGGASALHLTGLDTHGEWSEVLEISSHPFSWKSAPRLAVTRDLLPPAAEGEGAAGGSRFVLHLVWAEQGPEGDRVSFAPVGLRNGGYSGDPPVFDLHDLLPAEPTAETALPARSLVDAPALRPGSDDHTVVVAYTDPDSRRLITVEVETLPAELAALAGDARAHITVLGQRGTVQSVADGARAHITVLGQRYRFHPAIVRYLAERVSAAILAAGQGAGPFDPEELAELARREILEGATGIEGRGLLGSPAGPDGAAAHRFLELDAVETGSRGDGPPATGAWLRVERLASWPAPAVPEAPLRLFLSPSGRDVIVAWAAEGRLEYRETEGGGWSAVRRLELGAQLSLAAAYELLENRVR
jgi:hypothetical protein